MRLVLIAMAGMVMAVPGLAQAFAVEEDSAGNQLSVVIRNVSATDELSNVSVTAQMPSFCSGATPLVVPATVPAGSDEIGTLEYDVLAGVAIGTTGDIVLTVSGTIAGQPVSSVLVVPLEVALEAPPFQGFDAVPALSPAMLVALVVAIASALAWATRRGRLGIVSSRVALLVVFLGLVVAQPALAGSPTVIRVTVEVGPPPPPPTNPDVELCGSSLCCIGDGATMSWSASPGATEYEVQWRCAVLPPVTTNVGNTTFLSDVVLDTGLGDGCGFAISDFKVRACNAWGCSDWTPVSAADTPISCGGGCCVW
jgi:hypothetical protein